MKSLPVRIRPSQRLDDNLLAGFDRTHLRCLAEMEHWLDAMPHAAAMLCLKDNDLSLVAVNKTFYHSFLEPVGPKDELPYCKDWRERIIEVALSEKLSSSFELRRDGPLGPEYFSCTAGLLPSTDDGAELILFTAMDRTNDRVTERNLRRELLSDGLTALPNHGLWRRN